MPHNPAGAGCMAPPISPCPPLMMSIKALRSRVSVIARRKSGLSNGGLSRLMIRLRLMLPGVISQIACGIWLFTSFNSGTVRLYGKVMSNFPAMNAKVAVERLRTMVYSMPSR